MADDFIHPQDILNASGRAFITLAEAVNAHGIQRLLKVSARHGKHEPRGVLAAYYRPTRDPVKQIDRLQGLIMPETALSDTTRRILGLYEEIRPKEIKAAFAQSHTPKIVKTPAGPSTTVSHFVVIPAGYLADKGLYKHVENVMQAKLNAGQHPFSLGSFYGSIDVALRPDAPFDPYERSTYDLPISSKSAFSPFAGSSFIEDIPPPAFSSVIGDPLLERVPCWDKKSDDARQQAVQKAVLRSRETKRWVGTDIGQNTVYVLADPVKEGVAEAAVGRGQSNLKKIFRIAAGEEEDRRLFTLKAPKITFRVTTDERQAREWNAARIILEGLEREPQNPTPQSDKA